MGTRWTRVIVVGFLLALGGAALVAWVGRTKLVGRPPSVSSPTLANPKRTPALPIAALAVLALAPLSQAIRSFSLVLEQNNWLPNNRLVYGVGTATGMAMDEQFRAADDRSRAEFLDAMGPMVYVNMVIRPQETPNSGVYLLGDSTPLYFLGAIGDLHPGDNSRSVVLYHTTWDGSPLLASPARPGESMFAAWTNSLHQRGVRYVLVNYSELERLIDKSHYYDPRVTMEDVQKWLRAPESRLSVVRTWRNAFSELFEILPDPSAPASTSTGAAR